MRTGRAERKGQDRAIYRRLPFAGGCVARTQRVPTSKNVQGAVLRTQNVSCVDRYPTW